MVRQAKTSKRIAIELGLAPVTVDQRCSVAVKKLGARDRQEAAIMLEKHERRTAEYGCTIYEPLELPETSTVTDEPRPSGGGDPPGTCLQEERAVYTAFEREDEPEAPLPDRYRRLLGEHPSQSVLLLLLLVIVIVITATGGVAMLEALTRMRGR